MKTAIVFRGYIDWVYPWRIAEGEQFYMFGDHWGYCPVTFEGDEMGDKIEVSRELVGRLLAAIDEPQPGPLYAELRELLNAAPVASKLVDLLQQARELLPAAHPLRSLINATTLEERLNDFPSL